jgi:hypothetical protein
MPNEEKLSPRHNLSQLIASKSRTSGVGKVLFEPVAVFAVEMAIQGIVPSFLDVRFASRFAPASFSAITRFWGAER